MIQTEGTRHDIRFINAELNAVGRAPIAAERVVDTLALARRKHPGAPNNLDALCDRYRIDRSRRIRHGALLDAEILVEVYGELTGGRQRSLSFAAIESGRRDAGPAGAARTTRPVPLAPRLSEAERRAHRALVATLGDAAIWPRYAAPERDGEDA